MEDAKKVNKTKVSNLLLGKKKNHPISKIPIPLHPKPLVSTYNQELSKE